MNTNARLERAIVTVLIEELGKAGFVPVKVWDGEAYQPATTLAMAIDAVFSVDESTLHFAPRGKPEGWGALGVLLIGGNGPDIVSNWHCKNAEFDAAVRRACDRCETSAFTIA